jgi:hypothetical protein
MRRSRAGETFIFSGESSSILVFLFAKQKAHSSGGVERPAEREPPPV